MEVDRIPVDVHYIAISLWQPWASLVTPPGPKTLETRGWDTSYRGQLLICAAKGGLSKEQLLQLVLQSPFFETLRDLFGFNFTGADPNWRPQAWARQIISRLPLGKAVATCNLVETYKTENIVRSQIQGNLPFGDFSPGRFAWQLEDRKAIADPFPVRGRQQLFEVEVDPRLLP